MVDVTLKPIEIAKGVWEHALNEDRKNKGEFNYKDSKIYHYYGVLAMFAAGQAAHYAKDEAWLKEVNDMLGRYPDDFDAPDLKFPYNFDNYRCGGTAKSWMALHGYFPHQKEVLREYAEKTMAAPRSHDGIMCMPRCPEKEQIWIDSIYAVTPYMLHTGLLLGEQNYIDFGCDQCFKMYDVFLDPATGLVHQSRGFMGDKTTISEDHWSRGNGWCYIGLTELIRYLPKDDKNYEGAVKRFVDLSNAFVKFQSKKGLWKQEMAVEYSWEESSGTGLILYGLGVGMRKGLLDKATFMPVFEKGVRALVRFCLEDDFATLRCCHGFLFRCIPGGSGYCIRVHLRRYAVQGRGAFLRAIHPGAFGG